MFPVSLSSHIFLIFAQQQTFHFFFSLYLNVSFACLPLLQSAKVTSHAQLSSIRLYYKHPDILLK